MDTELLVDNRIEDGHKLIAELLRTGFDVSVAFWAKTSEEGLWSLFLGSKNVDAGNLAEAFSRVYACLRKVSDSSLAFSDIKLLPVGNPIALDAMKILDRYTAAVPVRFRGSRLGSMAIEEAYLYPRVLGTMTPNEVVQTVIGLMNRRGLIEPSLVTLRGGSTVRAVPRGVQARTPGEIQIVLLNVATDTEQMVPASDVLSIQ